MVKRGQEIFMIAKQQLYTKHFKQIVYKCVSVKDFTLDRILYINFDATTLIAAI